MKKQMNCYASRQSISEEELKESTEMFYCWDNLLPEQIEQAQQLQIGYYNSAQFAIKSAKSIFEREYYIRQMQRTLECINHAERLMEFSGYEYVPFVPYC